MNECAPDVIAAASEPCDPPKAAVAELETNESSESNTPEPA